MDLTHKELKQACRKNQYKLSLTFMEGDGDGYEYGEIYSEYFEGEIQGIFDIFRNPPKHGDDEKLRESVVETIVASPVLLTAAMAQQGVESESSNYSHRDIVSDYLTELGYGYYGPSYDYPRAFWSMELTHFDMHGDEYLVERKS